MSDDFIDHSLVDELKDVMGDDFSTLVASFQRDSSARLLSLRDHCAAGDAEAVRQTAHSFKGSSSNVGALKVAALCLSVEQQANAGDLAAIPALVDELESAFNHFLTVVF